MNLMKPAALIAALVVCLSAQAAGEYRIETVAAGLEHPWSLAFLPDGRILVTERAGRLRVITVDHRLVDEPVAGVPDAYVAGQGGLFEVLPDPGFAENRLLYLSLAHGTARANTTRVVRGRLTDMRLEDVETIFDARPMKSTPAHFGGRMAFLPDGTLVLGLGDGFDYREEAQSLASHLGAIVRIKPDGSVPADNPFVGRAGALAEIYSYGHRNVQGLVWDGDNGILWQHEHGPRGGDELNRIEPGLNYGWPVITYGVDYSGARITPFTHMEGMEQPLVDWTPSIAPAGMTRYTGDLFPEWTGDLFVAALVNRSVWRVKLDNGRVSGQERILTEPGLRMRDVRTGPDGALWLLTDQADGRILRVVPVR